MRKVKILRQKEFEISIKKKKSGIRKLLFVKIFSSKNSPFGNFAKPFWKKGFFQIQCVPRVEYNNGE